MARADGNEGRNSLLDAATRRAGWNPAYAIYFQRCEQDLAARAPCVSALSEGRALRIYPAPDSQYCESESTHDGESPMTEKLIDDKQPTPDPAEQNAFFPSPIH
ncbi:hypothetical protein KBAH04_33010 [Aeromonas hydrophila]|nr:hypothetical protein KBAH04_33010 [Aeromonas hydrophila]